MKNNHHLASAFRFTGMIAISCSLSADSSAPYNFMPFAKSECLQFQTHAWSFGNNTLSRIPNRALKLEFALVKPTAVKVPTWYQVSCLINQTVSPRMPLPVVGIVFGYTNKENYWSLRFQTRENNPYLALNHTINGRDTLVKEVPFEHFETSNSFRLGVEVNESGFIVIIGNRYHLFKHHLGSKIENGQFGVFSNSADVTFSELELSGVAKR